MKKLFSMARLAASYPSALGKLVVLAIGALVLFGLVDQQMVTSVCSSLV